MKFKLAIFIILIFVVQYNTINIRKNLKMTNTNHNLNKNSDTPNCISLNDKYKSSSSDLTKNSDIITTLKHKGPKSYLVQSLPAGCKLTGVIDACHSGTGMDLAYEWTRNGWREDTNPLHVVADVQMWSGCTDCDVSADGGRNLKGGAMTNAFVAVLTACPHPTYPQLLASLHQTLQKYGFSQRPNLTSSQPFDFSRHMSINDDIMPNMNRQLGRIFRRRFQCRPNKHSSKQMKHLGLVAGVAAAGMGMLLLDALF
jgi:hypothetical protein